MWLRRGRSCMLHWCVFGASADGGAWRLAIFRATPVDSCGTRWDALEGLFSYFGGESVKCCGREGAWRSGHAVFCDLHWVTRCPPTEVGQRPPGMLPHGPFLLVAFRFFRAPLPRGRQCARCRAHPVCGTCGGLSQPPFIALLGCDDCKFWHVPRHLFRPVLTQR